MGVEEKCGLERHVSSGCHTGLVQLLWHNQAFGAVCEVDHGGAVLIVEYVIDGDQLVIVLEILPSYLGNSRTLS